MKQATIFTQNQEIEMMPLFSGICQKADEDKFEKKETPRQTSIFGQMTIEQMKDLQK